jgi:hypothetical protein
VFSEILHNQPSRIKGNFDLMLEVLFRYIELLKEDFQESSCGGKFKQLASQMCRGALWRKHLLTLNSIRDHEDFLKRVRDGSWRPKGPLMEDASTEIGIDSCDQFTSP